MRLVSWFCFGFRASPLCVLGCTYTKKRNKRYKERETPREREETLERARLRFREEDMNAKTCGVHTLRKEGGFCVLFESFGGRLACPVIALLDMSFELLKI